MGDKPIDDAASGLDRDSSLGHTPGEKWEFDADVARVFDDMLRRSIPDYQGMRDACLEIGAPIVRNLPKSDVVDVGCSRGAALEPFVRKFGCANRFVGLERSDPMIEAARLRFIGYDPGVVEIRKHELRDGFPGLIPGLTLCVLTLQFLTLTQRRRVLAEIRRQTRNGGGIIVVEKLLGETYDADDFLVDRYHAMKEANGYSREEIERKRKSLEGVMSPLTASHNVQLLKEAGFEEVDCFWRRLNFAGFFGFAYA